VCVRVCVCSTSALSGNDQRLLLRAPAHGGASGESEDVGLLGGEARDGELPRVGPHLHRGPPPGVPAVQAVRDLVAWARDRRRERERERGGDGWNLCGGV